MNETLKRLIAGTTALRLLVSELRELDPPDFYFTGIYLNSHGVLSVQVRTDEEAAPVLAIIDGEWQPELIRDTAGYYQRQRRCRWAGVDVELNICHRLPEPEDLPEDGEPRG